MSATQQKTMNLSIRLLKDGETPLGSLRANSSLKRVASESGILFVDQSPAKPPNWYGFVEEFAVGALSPLQNQSCAAVLFLEVISAKYPLPRYVALTFGTGHHALNPDSFERRFGLRVALNCIARVNLKGLDIATLDATTFQKRIQASRSSDLQGFGLDVERDLLRLVAGVPDDAGFAKAIAGKDALSIISLISPDDVAGKCKMALDLYYCDDYKRDYSWVDLIAPVPDKVTVSLLDDLIYREVLAILGGGFSDLHLALPDILSIEDSYELAYFGVGLKSGKKNVCSELLIDDYIEQIRQGRPLDISNIGIIKDSHEVRVVVNGSGDRAQRQKIYDCFVFEVVFKGLNYVLFGGLWYLIDNIFYKDVEAEFVRVVSATPIVLNTFSKNERDFIVELDKDPDLLNLDQVKISPLGTVNSNLEPCDFLCKQKRFIHLKDGHSSAPISHLWNQGLVSAESFSRDSKFRKDLRVAILRREKLSSKNGFLSLTPSRSTTKPRSSEYKIVFGIMRHRYKKTGRLGLPFFSKVSLRSVVKSIELMGYAVEVHLIEKL